MLLNDALGRGNAMWTLLLTAAVTCPLLSENSSSAEIDGELQCLSEQTEPSPRRLPPKLEEHFRKIDDVLKRPPPPTAGTVLYAQLAGFKGKPARHAFDRLGYPDKKIMIEGATVYSWVNETTNLDGSQLRCTVKVVVRAAKIANTDFFGNEGACSRFAKALDPTFHRNY